MNDFLTGCHSRSNQSFYILRTSCITRTDTTLEIIGDVLWENIGIQPLIRKYGICNGEIGTVVLFEG